MTEPIAFRRDAFVWNMSGGEVILTKEGNTWRVVCSGASLLFGPTHVFHSAQHQDARMAAWDVMNRVKRFASAEEGFAAGKSAATWLRQQTRPENITTTSK